MSGATFAYFVAITASLHKYMKTKFYFLHISLPMFTFQLPKWTDDHSEGEQRAY